jgi:hypothetical protein
MRLSFACLKKFEVKSSKYIFSGRKIENNNRFYGLIVPLPLKLQIFSELNELHLP